MVNTTHSSAKGNSKFHRTAKNVQRLIPDAYYNKEIERQSGHVAALIYNTLENQLNSRFAVKIDGVKWAPLDRDWIADNYNKSASTVRRAIGRLLAACSTFAMHRPGKPTLYTTARHMKAVQSEHTTLFKMSIPEAPEALSCAVSDELYKVDIISTMGAAHPPTYEVIHSEAMAIASNIPTIEGELPHFIVAEPEPTKHEMPPPCSWESIGQELREIALSEERDGNLKAREVEDYTALAEKASDTLGTCTPLELRTLLCRALGRKTDFYRWKFLSCNTRWLWARNEEGIRRIEELKRNGINRNYRQTR
jgi:hypothetical protein